MSRWWPLASIALLEATPWWVSQRKPLSGVPRRHQGLVATPAQPCAEPAEQIAMGDVVEASSEVKAATAGAAVTLPGPAVVTSCSWHQRTAPHIALSRPKTRLPEVSGVFPSHAEQCKGPGGDNAVGA